MSVIPVLYHIGRRLFAAKDERHGKRNGGAKDFRLFFGYDGVILSFCR
ncbi:hypothetical protein NB646_06405 [Oxalobacter aliiformigenes]|uniref:Uncharacterized protein n=1 Tax=Oxalobacter aliiformigenes TaxID=2946593 RepID=A0A9E9LA23_9BURK|nr:hypothetical protein [Oxalobacter aliiformigenes]WAV90502.1 hypothetical protein NB646_06405 [Oxalobacter aliiformigenes]